VLAEAVARNYFKLLAYKDEYEVARLYTQTGFLDSVRRNFGAGAKLNFHLSPPIWASLDPDTKRPRKYRFGPWLLPVLRVLARLRGLRGTKLDPFRFSADRRLELRLVASYEALVERVVAELDANRFELAAELLALPARIRGFGPIKQAAAELAAADERHLLERWAAAPDRARPARAPARASAA
jgi:indolepyruvate ferredoxin oxidoreductase